MPAHVPLPHKPQSAGQVLHVSLAPQLPSPQEPPPVHPGLGVFLHRPPLQESVVHVSLSLHSRFTEQHLPASACEQTPAVQVSVVQGFLSSQSALLAQQPVAPLCWQVPLAHVSVVQLSPSLQSASLAQQLGIAACLQVLAAQVSAVQALLSSQPASLVQQLGSPLATWLHWPLSQESMVQALASLHSALVPQQPAIGALTHMPPVQVSVVQALLSLQPASSVQVTVFFHWQRNCRQVPAVAPVGSMQSASAAQQFGSGLVGLLYLT